MAPPVPVPGICPEGLIRVETSSEERSDLRQLSLASHTICWTPIGGDRNTSFSRFAYYRMTSGGNVSVKCQKTGSENRMLKVCLWLTIERINNSQIKDIFKFQKSNYFMNSTMCGLFSNFDHVCGLFV